MAILALSGGIAGGIFGILSGPVAMLASMSFEHYLHGTRFLGLELVVAPIVGAILGALEGTGLGAVWVFVVRRPRRLTIARLMLLVAISGPILALFVADPPSALFVLTNGLLLLPAVVLTLAAVVTHQEESDKSLRTPSRRDEEEFAGPSVRFSDWGDPDLLEQGKDESD